MSLRMVPLSGTFQKMNRIVRDMKKKLNKDVRLTLVGENTEVDKTVVDSIGDPIMHIVRNSMDHGVETTAEERIAAGKDPQAEIILSAAHTGSEVIISISDDGQGMDPDKILSKAERNGILTKPASSSLRPSWNRELPTASLRRSLMPSCWPPSDSSTGSRSKSLNALLPNRPFAEA